MATTELQLITIDPTTIRTADQIRQDAAPDEQLIESVRSTGILQPPTVVWNEHEAAYLLVFGARRVGAAIAAGLSEIPVIVRDPGTLTEALTLEEQIVENERRKGVTPSDLARGWARLEGLFGVSVEEIAAATGERPERVRAGIRAARSEKTTAVLAAAPTIDLEKAAILTEFDEHPKVQAELVEVATDRPENFDWRVGDARNKIAKEAKVAELKAEIKAKGAKLAPVDAYRTLKRPARHLRDLVDENGKKLTPARHKTCPGHVGYVAGWGLADLAIEWACKDPKTHGHREARSVPRELTDEEKQAEADRQARAAAIEANHAARRQWIHDLLPGKINQLPGVYEYMAAALLGYSSDYDHRASQWALPLLDIDTPANYVDASRAMTELLESKRVAPFRLMLATALGIHEKHLEGGHHSVAIVRHFDQLVRWGYQRTDLDTEVHTAHRTRLTEQAAAAETTEAPE